MFIIDAVKLAVYRAFDDLPRGQRRAAEIVNVPLVPHPARS
jgi:hypothetical protein